MQSIPDTDFSVFSILLCLTPGDFTAENSRESGSERVKEESHCAGISLESWLVERCLKTGVF